MDFSRMPLPGGYDYPNYAEMGTILNHDEDLFADLRGNVRMFTDLAGGGGG